MQLLRLLIVLRAHLHSPSVLRKCLFEALCPRVAVCMYLACTACAHNQAAGLAALAAVALAPSIHQSLYV